MSKARSTLFLLLAGCCLLTATVQAAPVVSSVSGSLTQGSTITVSGSSFGGGPSGVVFDDFEGGTAGNNIMTGAGSATVGQWDSTAGLVYYDDNYARSGAMSMESDWTSSYWDCFAQRNFPAGTDEVYTSWWAHMPTNKFPGEDNQYGINWKILWIQGSNTHDDDIIVQQLSGIMMAGNCGITVTYTGWSIGQEYDKGDWVRMSFYVKGGLTTGAYTIKLQHEDGTSDSWSVANGKTWGNLNGDDADPPRQYERVWFGAYGRSNSADSYTQLDDCYSTYGPNCRARVEIGNNPVYGSCTKVAVSAPTSWSGTSITATCNVGGMDPAEDWYVFVVDAANEPSAGYLVTGGAPTYTLTVNSGSGDGSYTAGTVVNISADAAPSGQAFDAWTGDVANVADVNAASTTITMPSANATVTATYADILYTLTVNSGTGDGSYTADTVVDITADAASSGQAFDAWTGDVANVADVNAASTTITMPAADATITATYKDASGGGTTLIVDWGDSEANNVYGFSDWNNVYLGPYTSYSSAGPDGIVGATTGKYGTCGVNGSAESFAEGDEIVVTWYNNTGSSVTFTPMVSFDDPDYPDGGTSGAWYNMSPLQLNDAETGTSGYTFTSQTAGSYNRVHVCRNISNEAQLMCDKIELVTSSPTTYVLTVNSGTGGGSYTVGTVVSISADAAPSGQAFDAWTGDVANVADVSAASTTITMPGGDATVTATYADIAWTLTVNSGTGSGDYTVGTVVNISADAAPSGQAFDAWTGDVVNVADVNAASTTITMPGGDATVTATYADIAWTLTVNSGSGGGSYTAGTVVNISADAAPSGMFFDAWTGDVANVADVNAAGTTITMPGGDATVTATYADIAWRLTVNSGTGSGDYTVGTVVSISADAAPSGQNFDAWTGDVANVAGVNAASTTITMPGGDAAVTATYADIAWTLTVNSGSGGGSYTVGTVVNISADVAPSGQSFDAWTGDVANVADVNAASTTITMPGGDATVTATYADIAWTLTVNSGSGGGSYTAGTVVSIAADAAPSGMFFDAWTGDVANVADVNAAGTTITMPANAAELTATYTWVADGLVSRYTFDMDARDTYGSNDGTLTGGALVTTDGTRGNVLSLDGTDDYVSLPPSAMAAGRSELTLSMWINPGTWAGGDTIWDEYANGNYWQFTILNGSFYTRDSSTGTTGSRDNDLSLPSISTGQWHHLAFVYSVSESLKAIYYDGSLYASTSTSVDTLTSARDGVGIGYACDGTNFDGLVDDVRLYSRALDDIEIARLAGQEIYTLTVNSGSGSGNYTAGTVVNIDADAAPSGQAFDAWTGDVANVADVNAAGTTITMPGSDATVTATYADIAWTLTVNSGTGDGSYTAGTVVDITADAAPSGMFFDAWTGDVANIADVNAASTTITMPGSDATVTATYADIAWTLTVDSGTGGGDYTAGTVVNISADAAPSGQVFDAWTGDVANIADVNAASTTITMPGGDATVTATYADIAWTLTVNSGTGDGSYTVGSVVNISADAAPSGQAFDAWTGDVANVADVNAASTTITMPGGDATVTATYKDAGPTTTLIVDWGDSEANNVYGFSDWYNVYLGPYQSYSSAGPDGIVGSSTAKYGTCGVNGSAESFSEGDKIVVTFYNNTGASKTFTPRISFDDADYPDGGSSSGTWYDMDQVVLGDAETGTAGYTFTAASAGSYSRVHVCRNIANSSQLLTDKIQLVAGSGSSTAYALTVNSGSGDGSYTAGTVVNISADAAPSGQAFDAWTGDVANVADVNAASTTITMPGGDATVTATYAAQTWTLTVNSGTGSGSYTAGTVVNISADAAPSGQAFDAWTGDVANVADVNASSTTITMPGGDATVTATYANISSGSPAVSGVSGTLSQGSTITISGGSFGAAPNVVLFDDFEGGVAGNNIMTGPGSAAIGQWNAISGSPYYDDTTSVSGSLAFQANMSDGWAKYAECLFPANTLDFFACWWMYIPAGDNIPGEGTNDGTNWKTVWVQGANTTDDDQFLPGILATSNVIGGNDSPYTGWIALDFQKGEWKRVWVWLKGGYNNDGACHFWELDSTNAVQQRLYDDNVTTMYSGGFRERIHMNGYGRTTPNCHPGFDDFYVATGANARARVEIGNAPTYMNCTALAIQAPTSWSSSSITARCNVGGLSAGDSWYLFVINADGDASGGYLLN